MTETKRKPVFPFSAIVGQDELRQALLIAAVDPSVGGVLIFGDRGTGKSTAVRGLASLLPTIEVIPGCAYRCAPDAPANVQDCAACAAGVKLRRQSEPVGVVDLPLGATEDRIVGALNIERALADGERVFEPGLLARANRGFLYIDEANLLEDHLVDLLLDVAASGENLVEREGLSVRHPARFVLVGSGNPEEGELRPQMLDRFGLAIDVRTPTDVSQRVEIVKRRDAFDRDPVGFAAEWIKKDRQINRKISAARKRILSIPTSDEMLELATKLCLAVGTDGLRGELTLIRSARAAAALSGAKTLEAKHLRSVAVPALRHRLRKDALDETDASVRVDRSLDELFGPQKS